MKNTIKSVEEHNKKTVFEPNAFGDKEEKKKESARIAKFREAKKDNGEQVTKKRPKEKQKS